MVNQEIKENISFEFKPDLVQFNESSDKSGWLQIGGTALTEGISANNNVYNVQNLKENDGRNFKWVFGHPGPGEINEHVVGKGKLDMNEGLLKHSGRIRNTANHPDVVEQVRDGLLEPSIHATARKVVREEGKYHVEG